MVAWRLTGLLIDRWTDGCLTLDLLVQAAHTLCTVDRDTPVRVLIFLRLFPSALNLRMWSTFTCSSDGLPPRSPPVLLRCSMDSIVRSRLPFPLLLVPSAVQPPVVPLPSVLVLSSPSRVLRRIPLLCSHAVGWPPQPGSFQVCWVATLIHLFQHR